jgi:hypothetical protein
MQALIPIAILSLCLGICEGLNVYKGPLFSIYLRKFNKKIESLTLPIIIILFSSWPVILIAAKPYISSYSIQAIAILLIITYVIKLVFWRYHHYTGGFIPKFTTALKWMSINSLINMDFLLPLLLISLNIDFFMVYVFSNIILKYLLSIVGENRVRLVSLINMEEISVFLGLAFGILIFFIV